MSWNWEKPEWPQFTFDSSGLEAHERQYLIKSGEIFGAVKHVGASDRQALTIELISDEAVKTSEIEGEILRRESVQSSLRQQFGLNADDTNVSEAERGIAEMMGDLYRNFAAPISHDMLFGWHKMLMRGDRRIDVIGGYRSHPEEMQVVTPIAGRHRIHFVAPPSKRMKAEMSRFNAWFDDSAPNGRNPVPALTRAGIAHLYFECIHPFEDGNGRIGRALAEKSLAQNLGQPTLIALAYTIERQRRRYYEALERNNQGLEITDWLNYFALTVLEAQETTISRVDFYVSKARFYERFRGKLNERQQKVVARMFQQGVEGFKGGLSAENYLALTRTSRATATRDLQRMVEIGAFTRIGELRHTRYSLNLRN
jgi:Fic family protein